MLRPRSQNLTGHDLTCGDHALQAPDQSRPSVVLFDLVDGGGASSLSPLGIKRC